MTVCGMNSRFQSWCFILCNSKLCSYYTKRSAGMRTAAYNADVASDRRRRENVPWHILYSRISLYLSDNLNLAQHILRKCFYCNAGAGRLACEVLSVNLVELSEIAHIGKEAGCLDNILVGNACCF